MLEEVTDKLALESGEGAVTESWSDWGVRSLVSGMEFRNSSDCVHTIMTASLYRSRTISGSCPPAYLCDAMLPLHRYLVDSACIDRITPDLTLRRCSSVETFANDPPCWQPASTTTNAPCQLQNLMLSVPPFAPFSASPTLRVLDPHWTTQPTQSRQPPDRHLIFRKTHRCFSSAALSLSFFEFASTFAVSRAIWALTCTLALFRLGAIRSTTSRKMHSQPNIHTQTSPD